MSIFPILGLTLVTWTVDWEGKTTITDEICFLHICVHCRRAKRKESENQFGKEKDYCSLPVNELTKESCDRREEHDQLHNVAAVSQSSLDENVF